MNKFILPGVFILLAVGIFFTFTDSQYAKLKDLREVNDKYKKALDASVELIKKRDQVVNAYNSISENDRERLEKVLPNYIDNVRFIIDIRSMLAKRGVNMKEIKPTADNLISSTSTAKVNTAAAKVADDGETKEKKSEREEVALGFTFTTDYDTFIEVLNDLESSLRIIEVSSITIKTNETGDTYDFELGVKTFWLPQQ